MTLKRFRVTIAEKLTYELLLDAEDEREAVAQALWRVETDQIQEAAHVGFLRDYCYAIETPDTDAKPVASHAVELMTSGNVWKRQALLFPNEHEATLCARNHYDDADCTEAKVLDWRIVPTPDPVNARWTKLGVDYIGDRPAPAGEPA